MVELISIELSFILLYLVNGFGGMVVMLEIIDFVGLDRFCSLVVLILFVCLKLWFLDFGDIVVFFLIVWDYG